jgi:hypothetical protein
MWWCGLALLQATREVPDFSSWQVRADALDKRAVSMGVGWPPVCSGLPVCRISDRLPAENGFY